MTLLAELKRRNVIRMAGLYLVGAWLVTQVAGTVLPMFGAPEWLPRSIVILLAIAFVPVLVFAWLFEITPDGLKRDAEVPAEASIAPRTAKKMNRLFVALLVLAVVYFGFDKFVLAPQREAASVAIALQAAQTETDSVKDVTTDKSIAVLPFVNMSADPEQEYFSDGLSEEILNLLAQIGDLKVIGRTSSFAFKGKNEDMRTIGKTLGAAYLLEGSVRKAGNDLRITAQLIKAADGTHLWSQSYDRKLENVFAIQSEIAGSIAQAMKVKLLASQQGASAAQATTSLPAYELFLKARGLIHGRTRGGMAEARRLLEDALNLDPNYAPALAALAQTFMHLSNEVGSYGDLPREQSRAMAKPLLEKALALDPKLAEAHAVQGLIFRGQRDFARAEAALARALTLNPNLPDALHWQGILLGNAGRLREQLAVRQRLDVIDPLNVAALYSLNGTLRDSGRLTEAQAVTARMLRVFPESPQSFTAQALDQLAAGRLAEAQVPAARVQALGSNWAPALNAGMHYTLGDFDRVLSLQGNPRATSGALIALGRSDEAVAAARERFAAAPDDRGAAGDLFTTLSLAGRADEVLTLYRERWGDLAAVEAYFTNAATSGPFEAIAAAQRATGDHNGLAGTLAILRKRGDFQREQGYASGEFRMTEARYLALAGERAAALKALTQAIDLGVRDPLLSRDPAFAGLKDDPGFKQQVSRMTQLINIERAKLKMAPLP